MSHQSPRACFMDAVASVLDALDGFVHEGDEISPVSLRDTISGIVDGMASNARAAGATAGQIDAVRLALAATVDEKVLATEHPERIEWLENPLQVAWFDQHDAGEAFFSNLDQLLASGDHAVAEVYLACLAYGFKGKHRFSDGQALTDLTQRLLRSLSRNVKNPGPMVGGDRRVRRIGGGLRLGRVALATAVLMGLVWLGAAGLVSHEQQRALDTVEASEKAFRETNIEAVLEEVER